MTRWHGVVGRDRHEDSCAVPRNIRGYRHGLTSMSNRNANRDASDHREVVEAILRTGGSTWADAGPGTELEERLSEAEHRRWMASKVMSGFAYGATRDKVKKLHPDLVDYAGLSEDAKEKDRENVRFLATLSSVS